MGSSSSLTLHSACCTVCTCLQARSPATQPGQVGASEGESANEGGSLGRRSQLRGCAHLRRVIQVTNDLSPPCSNNSRYFCTASGSRSDSLVSPTLLVFSEVTFCRGFATPQMSTTEQPTNRRLPKIANLASAVLSLIASDR